MTSRPGIHRGRTQHGLLAGRSPQRVRPLSGLARRNRRLSPVPHNQRLGRVSTLFSSSSCCSCSSSSSPCQA